VLQVVRDEFLTLHSCAQGEHVLRASLPHTQKGDDEDDDDVMRREKEQQMWVSSVLKQ
jgi:hypothetical protein